MATCRKISLVIGVVIMFLGLSKACAQNNLWNELKKIKHANASKTIAYTYSIIVSDIESGKSVDSIKGLFQKSGLMFFDSNDVDITAFSGNIYCKLNHTQKLATIYNVKYLQEKLGLTIDSNSQAIPVLSDSLILMQGNTKLEFTDKLIIARMKFVNQEYSNVVLELDRQSYVLQKMRLESRDDEQIKIYSIENINYLPADGRLNFARFYKRIDNRIVLDSKYSKYKLTSITE